MIGHLARHDEIAIAGPVLRESARLSEDDLIEIAETKSEPHLLAVSGRWWLKEVVTDALLARQYPSVSRRIVGNPGARISAAGFAIVVAQAETDAGLAVEAGIRVDLPSDTAPTNCCASATEAVRTRLLYARAAPPVRGDPRLRSRPRHGERRSRDVESPRLRRSQAPWWRRLA